MAITNITEGVIYRDGKFLIPPVHLQEDENTEQIMKSKIESFRFDDGESSYDVDFDGTNWNFSDFKLLYYNPTGSITDISNVNIEWENIRFRLPAAVTSFTFMDGDSSYEYEWVVDEWVLSFFNYFIDYTEQVTVGDIDPVGVTFSANVFTVPAENTEFTFTDDGMKYGYVDDNGLWNRYTLLVNHTEISTVGSITNGVTFNANIFTVPVGVKSFMFTDNGVEYFAYCNLLTWHIIETQVNDGADYVVALWGDDTNTGAWNQPFLTWQKAFDTANAGDTIHFRAGVYYRQQEDSTLTIQPLTGNQNSGTVGNIISYFGSPTDLANGDPVIYDCIMYTPPGEELVQAYNGAINLTALTDDPELRTSGYIHFKDFTIRNVRQTRPMVSCQAFACVGFRDMTFERIIIHDVGGRGFNFDNYSGMGHTHFINCDTYRCFDVLPYNQYTYDNNFPGHDGTGLLAVVLDTAESGESSVTIDGCRSWENSKYGYAVTSGGNAIFKNTWAFMIGEGYAWNETGYGVGYRLEAAGGIYQNDQPDLITFAISNSMTVFARASGFHEMTRFVVNRNMYNNIAYGTVQGYVIQSSLSVLEGPARERKYTNNLGYNNSYTDIGNYDGAGSYTDTTNSWSNPPDHTVADADFEVMLTDEEIFNELKAPRKADGSLPDLTVFKIAAASPLKAAGTDVGMSTTPDIGIDWAYLEAE